jgi:hypothetical protein
MSNQIRFTLTPKQIYEKSIECIQVGLVPLVVGPPGSSKSTIAAKIAKDFRLKLIDIRLSQYTPEDLQGLPMRSGNKATFAPYDVFPIEEDPLPEGYDGWMLFLDEFTGAPKPTQLAAYKLVLDRMTGSHKLHERVVILAAGNRAEDNAVVTKMSTAMHSRVITLEMEVSHKEFLQHANENQFDHRVVGFLNYLPSRLMDFDPSHTDKTFACPRTWEFASRLVKGKEISEESMGALLSGTVGTASAIEFITFAKEYTRLPKIHDIETRPEITPIPNEMSTKYAAISMLIEAAPDHDLDKILIYVERFDIELQIVFARGCVARNPKLRQTHKGFSDYVQRMTRYVS